MNHDERYAWVQLALTPYIGAESFLLLLQHYGSAAAALCAPAVEVARIVHYKQASRAWQGESGLAQEAADKAFKWAEAEGCRLLLLSDDDFPPLLSEGMTPPPLLFVRGQLECLSCSAVAIVGSRHATPQAMRIARDFGQALSEQGIAVVSGMAAGIDTAAHQGALKGEGGTVAVLGTGIDRIYPQSNRQLAYEIAEKGLLVSEFPLGTRPLAANFPRRNRIIAALSAATLVVEAAVESGSLITARLAAEMGREVMAVPGSIDNPHSKGCHRLIKDGAKLVECLEDIVSECLGWQTVQDQPARAAPVRADTLALPIENMLAEAVLEQKEQGGLLLMMGFDPVHPDTLAERLSKPAGDIYAELLLLELDGVVAAVPGGRYQRIRR